MPPRKDITGQVFGHLTALESTSQKYRGSYVWRFKCDCGNVIESRIGLVTHGQIVSCGCHKSKNLLTIPAKDKIGLEYGTNISRIRSNKVPKNNTSGHRGVSLHRQKGKSDRWIAYIYFQGVRYHLGSYISLEDAISARDRAEKELHGNFLDWYDRYVKQDPDK